MKAQITTTIALLATVFVSAAYANGGKHHAMHEKCRTEAGVVKGQKPTDEQKAKIEACVKSEKDVAKATKEEVKEEKQTK